MMSWLIGTIIAYSTSFLLGFVVARRRLIQKATHLLNMIKPWMDTPPKDGDEYYTFLKIGGMLDAMGYLTGAAKTPPGGYEFKKTETKP